jgi:hypothetical protein
VRLLKLTALLAAILLSQVAFAANSVKVKLPASFIETSYQCFSAVDGILQKTYSSKQDIKDHLADDMMKKFMAKRARQNTTYQAEHMDTYYSPGPPPKLMATLYVCEKTPSDRQSICFGYIHAETYVCAGATVKQMNS